MLNLDNIVSNKKMKEYNNWPFRMLIIAHQVLVKLTLYFI